MTIHLPSDLEGLVPAKVQSGRFANEDALVAEAVRLYLHTQETPQPTTKSEAEPAAQSYKPIWEVIEEETRSIPPEVWDALPTDLSEQHDHFSATMQS